MIATSSEETIDPDSYFVEFKNGDKDNSKATDLATDALKNTYNSDNEITAQALTLAVSEKADLGHTGHLPVIHSTKKYSDTFAYDSATYSVEKYLDSNKVVTGTFSGTPANTLGGNDITGYKAGSDVITITAKKTGYDSKTNNTGIYSDTLPVTVVDQFTGLEIKASSDAISDNASAVSTLSIYGTDGRTGVTGQQALKAAGKGVYKVVWSFLPDQSREVSLQYGIQKSGDTSTLLPKISAEYGSGISSGADKDPAYITATIAVDAAKIKDTTKKITVQAEVYSDASTKIATLTKELNVVEGKTYQVVPTLTIKDQAAIESSGLLTGDATNGAKLHSIETKTAGTNTATITHKVYEIVDSSNASTTIGGNYYDAKKVKEAVDKGYIKEVTTGIEWKSELVRNTAASSAFTPKDMTKETVTYAELTDNENGNYTITGKNKTSYTSATAFDAMIFKAYPVINGISLATSSTTTAAFRVVDSIEKYSLTFNLNGVKYASNGEYVEKSAASDIVDKTPAATTTTSGNGTVVVRMLDKSKVLSSYTHSEILNFTKEYTTGVVINDVTLGTEYKLPEESDFTAANKDPRAVLAGWKNTTGTYKKPGDKVSVSKTASDNVWTAIWVPSYVLNKTVGDAPITAAGVENTVKTASWSTTAPAIVNGIVPTAGNVDIVSPFDSTGKTKYSVYKTAVSTAAEDVSEDVKLFVQKYNGFDTANGYVIYDDYNPENFTLAYKEGVTTQRLTLGSKTIKGKSAGAQTAGDIIATMTDGNGATWEVTSPAITVSGESPMYAGFNDASKTTTVDKDDNNLYYIKDGLTSLTLQKSQSAETITAVLAQGAAPSTLVDLSSNYANYKIEFSLASGDSVVTLKQGTGSSSYTANITPKTTGEAVVNVKFTDMNGTVSKTAALAISVVDDDITIEISDKNDKPFAGSVTGLGNNANGVVFHALAKDKSGNVVSGAWQNLVLSGEDFLADGTYSPTPLANKGASYTISTASKDIGENDEIEIEFQYTDADGKATKYRKAVTIETHYELVLGGGKAVATADAEQIFIKVGNERVLDKDKTENAGKDVAAENKTIEITTANRKNTGTEDSPAYKYDIDLANYTAEIVKADQTINTAKEFKFWFKDGSGSDATFTSSGAKYDDVSQFGGTTDVGFKKKKVTDLALANFANGTLNLLAYTDTAAISAATPSVSEVVLEDASGKTYKDIEIAITPSDATGSLVVVPEQSGFYTLYATKVSTQATSIYTSADGYKKQAAATAVTGSGVQITDIASGIHTFSVGYVGNTAANAKAGKTVLHIYDTTDLDNELASVTLVVNGLNTENGVTTYLENGQKVVSDTRTVGTKTYIFDEKGEQVTGTKVVDLNGKSVVVIGGAVAGAGYHPVGTDGYVTDANGVILSGWQEVNGNTYYADPANENKLVTDLQSIDGKYYYFNSYILVKAGQTANEYENNKGAWKYYVNAKGEAAVGGIAKVDGVDRLFKEDGSIVTYADTTEGKITIGNTEYLIDPSTNEAKPTDKTAVTKLEWSAWPATDKVSATTAPEMSVTLTLQGEKAGKIADPKVVTANVVREVKGNKLTYTATADLSAYYKDTKYTTKYAADETKTTKTYTLDDNGNVIGASQAISANGEISIDGLDDEYAYTGAAIQPAFVVVDGDTVLAKGVDYTVSFKNNKNVDAVAQIIVKGKGNYTGQGATATFKIVDAKKFNDLTEDDVIDLKTQKVKIVSVSPASFTYDGEAKYPESITLSINGKQITYTGANGDYTSDDTEYAYVPAAITFSNNVNKGTATILLSGKNNAKGVATTVKKTFKITAAPLSSDFTIDVAESANWAVKGAVPAVTVTAPNGEELIAGQDYVVKYANNKKITDASITVTGKNNYSGSLKNTKTFKVNQLDLSDLDIIATTAYDGVKASGVKVTILDENRDPIPAGKLVIKVEKDGSELAKGTKLSAGDQITVTATAKAGSELTESKSVDVTVGANLAKAKVTLTKGYAETYTGEEIKLESEDFSTPDKNSKITVTLKFGKDAPKTLTEGTDFEVAGYTNNVKKGSMTVTIVGTGNDANDLGAISGTKTFKVKINAKNLK